MNIIIIGFGSIGQRHYKNLITMGFEPQVYDIDQKKIISSGVKYITVLNKKELRKFDVAIICNPNNEHIKSAIMAAEAKCHLFVEKPLSHTLRGVEKLKKLCHDNHLIAMVACNMRFHPCLNFIKKYIESGKLGKIYSMNFETGSYLPDWRPWQDYTKNYAAKKRTGGGIIFDGIHEFDLLFWMNNFKQVVKSKFIFGHVSDLKIETEDICIATFMFKNKVLGLVKCDYLQRYYSRNCKIVGFKGSVEWDFNDNIVWLKNKNGKKKIKIVKNFDFNQVYIKELKYFLKQVTDKKQTFNDVCKASKLLIYCVARK